MPAINRRTFLKGAAATAGATALGGSSAFMQLAAGASSKPAFRQLRAIPDQRDGIVRLWLPEGFSYRSFHDTDIPSPGITLDDGTTLPGRHDGMAAFPGPNGHVLLVRNHEINGSATPFGPGAPYDLKGPGGTTTVEVSTTGEVFHSYTSLNGTQNNCAGGRMLWGSWITAEETVNGPDVGPDFTGAPNTALSERHGFIYEVPAGGQSNRQPIRSAGRFAHEAAAWDPAGGALYMTEDNFGFPSGLYRYFPPSDPVQTGALADGGQLQMAAVIGTPNANLASNQALRATYDIEWVDIDDPAPEFPYTPGQTAPTTNNDALNYVGNQGRAQGAAYFSRLEGIVYDEGVIYFDSTQGGGAAEGPDPIGGYGNGNGQIWAYHRDEQQLQLLFQSPGPDVLDLPDNLTASGRGTLVICEDGPAPNYIRGMTRGGQISDIALNRLLRNAPPHAPRFGEEFAGATFSPNGGTLFVNIQASQAITFAIWGPWTTLGV